MIKVRVSADEKAKAQAQADILGWPSMSAFVRDLILKSLPPPDQKPKPPPKTRAVRWCGLKIDPGLRALIKGRGIKSIQEIGALTSADIRKWLNTNRMVRAFNELIIEAGLELPPNQSCGYQVGESPNYPIDLPCAFTIVDAGTIFGRQSYWQRPDGTLDKDALAKAVLHYESLGYEVIINPW